MPCGIEAGYVAVNLRCAKIPYLLEFARSLTHRNYFRGSRTILETYYKTLHLLINATKQIYKNTKSSAEAFTFSALYMIFSFFNIFYTNMSLNKEKNTYLCTMKEQKDTKNHFHTCTQDTSVFNAFDTTMTPSRLKRTDYEKHHIVSLW